jgi:CheY-like chemotaxis protein/HPt (histidine-containing phosphotransfer) domain-containing protein
MRRAAFLTAVAMAAGRDSPEPLASSLSSIRLGVTPSTREEAAAQGRLILVAEDNEINRAVIRHQLQALGYAADIAVDGKAAFVDWQAGDYALVLTDCHMPNMDGFALTQAIRRGEADTGRRTPIIAVTANAMKGEDERCLAAGMDAYLAKPVNMDQLRTTLERWMPIEDSMRDPADVPDAPKLPSAIDRGVLAAWLGDDSAAINSLLAKFRDTAVAAEREIGAASRAGDLPALAAAAHKLKGAAQTVGAAGVGATAATLEQAGKAGDRTRCREGLGPLAAELRRALADIDRMNAAAR